MTNPLFEILKSEIFSGLPVPGPQLRFSATKKNIPFFSALCSVLCASALLHLPSFLSKFIILRPRTQNKCSAILGTASPRTL